MEAEATAICNGRATAAIFISCRAAEFIPSASQHRPQMKMLPQQPRQVAAEVVVDAAEEMQAQLPQRRPPRALPQLRVA